MSTKPEAKKIEIPAPATWRKLNVVGKSLPKVDVVNKVTGAAVYTSDIYLSNMLTGHLVRSQHTRARIISIDKEAAMRVPDVADIITCFDVPDVHFSTAGYPRETILGVCPNVDPRYMEDRTLMERELRYEGEIVALILAENVQAAREAESLLKIEYEVLPHVADTAYALSEEAPLIHGGTGKNVIETEMSYGDLEEGFKKSTHIFEDSISVQGQQHTCMETSCSIAQIEPSGKVTLWSTTQVPFHIRRNIHEVLGIPMSKIRVIKPAIGGGFGERQMVQNEILCVYAAMRTKRSVRIELTREENIAYTSLRHPADITLKTGVDDNGKILAYQMYVRSCAGAYSGHSNYVTKAMCTKNPYKLGAMFFHADITFTNRPDSGAYRGYGNPQMCFAREYHFDRIAKELGMDPTDFRKRNIVQVGEQNPIALKSDWVLQSNGLEACIDAGKEAIKWDERREPQGSKRYGKGMSAALHVTGISAEPDFSSATITLNEDGTVSLLIGSPDLGQGSDTTHAQICAETLGINLKDVNVLSADTDVTSFDGGSYSSRQTFVAGNAIILAAQKVKEQVIKYAAEMTGQQRGNLDTYDGWIVRKENGRRVTSMADLAYFAAYKATEPIHICESASYNALNCPPAFAAHFADVEVDVETGAVKILNFVAAHDVGKAINPDLVTAQVEGAAAQGIGYALTEDMIYDGNAKLLNNSFTDYKVPRSTDMCPIEVIVVEAYEPSGPYGAKSVGEMAVAPVAPAIANAIYDAAGIRIPSLPFTKEKVRAAIKEKMAKEKKS